MPVASAAPLPPSSRPVSEEAEDSFFGSAERKVAFENDVEARVTRALNDSMRYNEYTHLVVDVNRLASDIFPNEPWALSGYVNDALLQSALCQLRPAPREHLLTSLTGNGGFRTVEAYTIGRNVSVAGDMVRLDVIADNEDARSLAIFRRLRPLFPLLRRHFDAAGVVGRTTIRPPAGLQILSVRAGRHADGAAPLGFDAFSRFRHTDRRNEYDDHDDEFTIQSSRHPLFKNDRGFYVCLNVGLRLQDARGRLLDYHCPVRVVTVAVTHPREGRPFRALVRRVPSHETTVRCADMRTLANYYYRQSRGSRLLLAGAAVALMLLEGEGTIADMDTDATRAGLSEEQKREVLAGVARVLEAKGISDAMLEDRRITCLSADNLEEI
jgi:hypothetical protein